MCSNVCKLTLYSVLLYSINIEPVYFVPFKIDHFYHSRDLTKLDAKVLAGDVGAKVGEDVRQPIKHGSC